MAHQSITRTIGADRLFAKMAWGLLVYNLLVILWGVYVRVSGSGAGCGGHWPSCNGQIIPLSPQMNTLIEFTHRVTSGISVLLAVGLFLWAWKLFPKKHPVLFFSGGVLLFTFTEALIGAGLVLFGLVANNASVIRAFSTAMHLVNTLFLIGSVTLTAWFAQANRQQVFRILIPTSVKKVFRVLLGIALAGVLLTSAAGTVTALGDTLFPTNSLAQGFQQDISPLSNFLIRLRVIHPMLAVTLAVFTVSALLWMKSKLTSPFVHLLSNSLLGLIVLQVSFGVLNVALLAPVWIQFAHLLVSDLIWIGLVIYLSQVIEPMPLKFQDSFAG